ncbi:MAG TPA: LysR family transcriptional regulator [Paucimonas sp.]|nr:LysR family transcriptional regulator [Paucimonas sp.]
MVEKNSLTAAADAMDTSLISVVRPLSALEMNFGIRLLSRTTRSIALVNGDWKYVDALPRACQFFLCGKVMR